MTSRPLFAKDSGSFGIHLPCTTLANSDTQILPSEYEYKYRTPRRPLSTSRALCALLSALRAPSLGTEIGLDRSRTIANNHRALLASIRQFNDSRPLASRVHLLSNDFACLIMGLGSLYFTTGLNSRACTTSNLPIYSGGRNSVASATGSSTFVGRLLLYGYCTLEMSKPTNFALCGSSLAS